MEREAGLVPAIMGVVNVTPDSFSDGGRFNNLAAAVDHAMKLVADGAAILDVGGESTRPGAECVPVELELARTIPLIEELTAICAVPVSIDTRKPEVAAAAVAAGAAIWNDVSALTYSPGSMATAAGLDCDLILMHAQGDPSTMQVAPAYDDAAEEVRSFLGQRIDVCIAAGIERKRIMIDPGIGFGKTLGHNLSLFRSLGRLTGIAPVLLGASRKRFIAELDRPGPADARLGGSLAAAIAGAAAGVSIVRVHDVAATRQALAVWRAVRAD